MKLDNQAESFSPLKKSLVPLSLGNFEFKEFKYFMYDSLFLQNCLNNQCIQCTDTKVHLGNLWLRLTDFGPLRAF